MEERGFLSATVIKYEIDGCSWLIELKDGKRLQPMAFKEEFKKDELKVWIKFSYRKKGEVGICMAGTMVDVTEIEIRKDE